MNSVRMRILESSTITSQRVNGTNTPEPYNLLTGLFTIHLFRKEVIWSSTCGFCNDGNKSSKYLLLTSEVLMHFKRKHQQPESYQRNRFTGNIRETLVNQNTTTNTTRNKCKQNTQTMLMNQRDSRESESTNIRLQEMYI